MRNAAVAVPRAVGWERVDWETVRERHGEVVEAVRWVRQRLEVTPVLAPPGGDALSLRERVGVRGTRGRTDLLRALGTGSIPAVADAAAALAGLGEGSTPAGDDFLVGVMYALRAVLPADLADQLCAAIAEAAAPRTARLSAIWLQRAAGGEATPTWSFFLSSLGTGKLAGATERVLALGHTSGRAALAGFVATAEALGGTTT